MKAPRLVVAARHMATKQRPWPLFTAVVCLLAIPAQITSAQSSGRKGKGGGRGAAAVFRAGRANISLAKGRGAGAGAWFIPAHGKRHGHRASNSTPPGSAAAVAAGGNVTLVPPAPPMRRSKRTCSVRCPSGRATSTRTTTQRRTSLAWSHHGPTCSSCMNSSSGLSCPATWTRRLRRCPPPCVLV